MPDMTPMQRGAYERLPPSATGLNAINSAAVTTGAATINLNANWGGAAINGKTVNRIQQGGAWFSFQPKGGAFTFRMSSSSTAAVTASTGATIVDGSIEEFWIPSDTPFVDGLGSAALTLNYWMSSRNYAG